MDFTMEDKGLVFRLAHLDDEMLLAINRLTHEQNNFASLRYSLVDLSQVENFTVSAMATRRNAELDALLYEENPGFKIAIISTSALAKGLLNIYRAYFEAKSLDKHWEIMTFDNEQQARLWLG